MSAVAARQGVGGSSSFNNGGDSCGEPPLRLTWNGKTFSGDGVSNGGTSSGGQQPLADLGVHPGATLEVRKRSIQQQEKYTGKLRLDNE